jgi:hypothetical protein
MWWTWGWIAEIQGWRRLFALGTLIITFAVVGAACQSGGPGQSVSSASADADSLWWTGELRTLQTQYLATISLSCRSTNPLGHDQCMKGKLLESLSPNGEAGKHCSQDEIMVMFVECVDRLTTAERAYVALGLDPSTDMNWDDPTQSLQDASQLIGARLASKCMGSGQRDCLAREIAYMFATDPAESDRCAGSYSPAAQIRCAIGLSMIEKFRSAMLYVG